MTLTLKTSNPSIPPAKFSASAAFFQGGRVAEKTHATVNRGHLNMTSEGDTFSVLPPSYRQVFSVKAVSGNRVYIDDLSVSNSRRSGFLTGGQAWGGAILDGSWVYRGETNIVGNVLDARTPINGLGSKLIDPSATTFTATFPNWTQPNKTLYAVIAAVDANGAIGALSSAVSFTTAPAPDKQTTDNTTVSHVTLDLDANLVGLEAPTNLQSTTADGGQSHMFTWSGVTGHAAYVILVSEQNTFSGEEYIELETGHGFQVGDFITVSMLCDENLPREKFANYRVWGSSEGGDARSAPFGRAPHYVDDNPNLSFSYEREADGAPFLRLIKTGTGAQEIKRFTHGGTGQDLNYYEVLVPGEVYRNTLELRSSDVATVDVLIVTSTGTVTHTLNLTNGWQTFDQDFSEAVLDTSRSIWTITLRIEATGTIDFKTWHTYKADAAPLALKTTMLGPLSKLDMLRDHEFIKTNPRSYDIKRLIEDPDKLRRTLMVAKQANDQRPVGEDRKIWLQVEYHLSRSEIAALAEWLCTPYDPNTDTPTSKPWAYIRHRQGQTTPWQDEFDEIVFEWGNENWNTLGDFYTMRNVSGESRATSMGKMLVWLFDELLNHPDVNKTKWRPFVGAWSTRTDWNIPTLAAAAPIVGTGTLTPWFGMANYNGGWDSGEVTAPSLDSADDLDKVLFNNENRNFGASGDRNRVSQSKGFVALAESYGFDAVTYEAGQGYLLPGAVAPAIALLQDEFMKTVAAGGATLFAWLANAAHGIASQDYFTLGNYQGGQNWKSHSIDAFGAVPNAGFQWVGEWWNEHAAGRVVYDLGRYYGVNRDTTHIGGGDFHALSAFLIAGDGKQYLAIHNRDQTSAHTFKALDLQNGSVTRHYMTGADFKASNIALDTKDDVTLATQTLAAISDGTLSRTIPAGVAEVFEILL